MQTNRLSADTIASITRLLAQYAQQNSQSIIGAQLGLLISEALRPHSLRSVGGLKSLTQNELRHLVQPTAARPDSSDVWFHINIDNPDVASAFATSASDATELAGLPLWRAFSNPRVPEQLAVNTNGIIRTVPRGASAPDGYKLMSRPSSDEYKDLARQFAEQQSDLAVRAYLLAPLEEREFYDRWISELRRLRTSSSNLLREWETVRAEYVAKKLQEALTACGVESARAAEVAANARPMYPSIRAQQHSPPTATPVKTQSRLLEGSNHEIAALRAFLHAAVDVMSLSELRELRLPAGTMHDAFRRAHS